MQAIQVAQYAKGPEDLKVSTLPAPVPRPNEYLIAVHASAANFFDLLQITGRYQHQPSFPWIAGAEYAGVVLSTPSVLPDGRKPKFQVGDRVCGASQGGFATRVCNEEERLMPIPKAWNFSDAAGLFVTGPTSYCGLVNRAGLREGDYVLVHAAAGGVGLAAVQVAKALGATVIATAGSEHKMSIARSFGADYAVDYRQDNWPNEVKRLTPGGRGVDIVYDPVGLVSQSLKCTAWSGRIVIIGFTGGGIEKVATNRILLKNVSIIGLHFGTYATAAPATMKQVWKGLNELIESGKFKGTCFTDQEFIGLERVPAALKVLGARESWGKVVVKVNQERGSKI